MSRGPEERELKFPSSDLEAMRERLRELEAERLAAAGLEDNRIFDRDGELAGRQCLLRLRTDRLGSRLTYKGPARFEGRVKVRVELETAVEAPEALEALLQALGYQVERRYQKKREEWRLGGVTVALDHTPIGDFVEFEGDGAERVANRCGFETAAAERRNYLELYRAYREGHPEAPPDMIFP